MARLRIRTPADFGFLPVVYSHGWFQCAPFHWDLETGILTRVVRDEGGLPTLLRMSEPARGLLQVTVGVEGRLSPDARRYFASLVTHMLQLERDISDFHALCRRHDHLALLPALGAGRLLRCPTPWEELVRAIAATNVAWPQAVRMISLVAGLGEPIDGMHAWPAPERVLEAGEEKLRERCRLGYRAPYIIELAARIVDGELDLGPIRRGEVPDDELRKLFLGVKGIGPATTDYLMILSGRTDRLSIDSAVYAYVGEAHFGGERPDAKQIEQLYEPFGQWRALAFWFEFLQEKWWRPAGFDFTRSEAPS
ncbi:MAG: hypothetical protein V3S52_05530 [Gemmatimonadota bacterium]|jgi:3-methyladenine DNA glycosylase/8-oxoguanine DNA glycosylase